jgi:hypothetical protein
MLDALNVHAGNKHPPVGVAGQPHAVAGPVEERALPRPAQPVREVQTAVEKALVRAASHAVVPNCLAKHSETSQH